jgi:purine-binding chemotaxis protein CheW
MEGRKPEKKSTPLDWEAIHHRLDIARASIEQSNRLTKEKEREILKKRASLLAQEAEGKAVGAQHLQILEFSLANETYGIESMYVREVYQLREYTPIPCTPPFILGVINIRGQVVSIVDLRIFFELPQAGLSNLNKVIVLHNDVMEFGILADAIMDTKSLPISDLQASLPTLTGIRQDYLKGVSKDRTVVLDAQKMLMDWHIVVNDPADSSNPK